MKRAYLPGILITLIFPMASMSENLGVYGSVYSIEEPDMLEGIHQKLLSLQESGELERQKKVLLNQSVSHVLRPKPVLGVTDIENDVPKHHTYNPSVVLTKNITDASGNVIWKAGTVVNPLNTIDFKEVLIFINGDNPKQVAWAIQKREENKPQYSQTKIILVNGDIRQTANALKEHVYFDQDGLLCNKFGIIHTPTMVYQVMQHGVRLPRLMVQEFRSD